MKNVLRLTLLFPLIAGLGACSSMGGRDYQASCVIGMSSGGALAGAFASISSGLGAGFGLGLVGSAFVCQETEPTEATPAMVEPVAVPPSDSDSDGVADDSDRCPNTPNGVRVNAQGCPLDSDSDGVADTADECAKTPTGVSVDERGCPIKDEVILTIDEINFAFDSAELDRKSMANLDRVLEVIQSHARAVELGVVGHTDSRGSDRYNLSLSEKRAMAVVDYLVSKGIDRDTLLAVGKGEAEPVASNDSEVGRAANRRVELVVR